MKCYIMATSRCLRDYTASMCSAVGLIMLCSVPATGQTPLEAPLVYNKWESFTTRDGLPHDHVRAIRVIDDHVWVGTDGGLGLYDGRSWQSWTQDDGLPSPVITAIDVDTRTDELWLGTWGGGLVRFTAGRLDTFQQTDSGLSGNLVFSVCVAGGRIWAATDAGLSSFNPTTDTWELYAARRADTPETAITNLSVNGHLLYGAGWGEVLHRLDLERGEWVSTAGLKPEIGPGSVGAECLTGPAVGLACLGRSTWLLTPGCLWRRYSALGWDARKFGVGSETGKFDHCLAARSETEVWVGTSDGLWSVADWPSDTWVTYRRCENYDSGLVTLVRRGQTVAAKLIASTVPGNRIQCIAFDQDAVWVGTAKGLTCGTERKPWTEIPANARGAKQSCPQPLTTASAGRKPRDESSLPKAVTIAVLGSGSRPIAVPGGPPRKRSDRNQPDLLAVQLALSEANAQGGYRGRAPFDVVRSLEAYRRYGWGTPEDDLAKFLTEDHALGVIAYVGPDYVVRSAVASRGGIPVVNLAGSVPSLEEQASSWVFRCSGDNPRAQERLIDYIVNRLGHVRFALLRTPGLMEREHLDLWERYVRTRKLTGGGLVAELAYDPVSGDLGVLESLKEANAEVVLTWADTSVSARILQAMRKRGMTQVFVGSEHIVCDEFPKIVGSKAGPVIAPDPCTHRRDSDATTRFVTEYTLQNSAAREKRPPAGHAYRTYHAARHLLLAINIAGLDRDALREVLIKMGRTRLATLKHGRWESLGLP